MTQHMYHTHPSSQPLPLSGSNGDGLHPTDLYPPTTSKDMNPYYQQSQQPQQQYQQQQHQQYGQPQYGQNGQSVQQPHLQQQPMQNPQHQQHQQQQYGQPQQQQQMHHQPVQLPPVQSYPGMSQPPQLQQQQPQYSQPPAPHYPSISSDGPPQWPVGQQSLAMSAPPPPAGPQQTSQSAIDRTAPFSGIAQNHQYTLQISQQPQRARMCGFGDKDRRPITPPPCVKLIITDLSTGNEVNVAEIDSSFFVLSVDLWDEKAGQEVNLVRSSTSSPAVSISTATTTSYPPPPERPMLDPYGAPMGWFQDPSTGQGYMAPMPQAYGQQMTPYGAPMGFGAAMYGQPAAQGGFGLPVSSHSSAAMFSRNLIGSLTVNASKLDDTRDKAGFWFVLQDLSVRTEGWFRLKMNFIDVGSGIAASNGGSNNSGLNKGKARVLASCFSEKFQVFSAKKFPGVIESTPLSKKFAQQGIKIPIRRDNKNDGGDEDD